MHKHYPPPPPPPPRPNPFRSRYPAGWYVPWDSHPFKSLITLTKHHFIFNLAQNLFSLSRFYFSQSSLLLSSHVCKREVIFLYLAPSRRHGGWGVQGCGWLWVIVSPASMYNTTHYSAFTGRKDRCRRLRRWLTSLSAFTEINNGYVGIYEDKR